MSEEIQNQPEQVVQQQPEVTTQQDTQKDQRDYNFRVMRERAERAEQRALELERALQPKPQSSDEFDVEDDGFIEGKHFKKATGKMKEMEKELIETKKQLEYFNSVSAEMQLRSKYNDFDNVVNEQNLEKLKAEKPALFRSILSNNNLRDQGESAYDAIMTFVKPKETRPSEQRIEENKAKPKSAATLSPQPSDSPLARAGDYDRRTLTQARKDELYQEMMEAKSRY